MSRNNEYLQKVNEYVGNVIYDLRLGKGMSRNELSELIHVTHQQLQKYEKGINRICIGRVLQLSKIFKVDVRTFLPSSEMFNLTEKSERKTQHQRLCLEVSRNFMNIDDPKHQESISDLIKNLANKK